MAFNPAAFKPANNQQSPDAMIDAAVEIIEKFTDYFNAGDLVSMDQCLHFPHVILSSENLIIWEQPGQMPLDFFDGLRSDGWHVSEYLEKKPVLVGSGKVHMFVSYTRNSADGSVISHHDNLWIITFDHGRWGIKQRSY